MSLATRLRRACSRQGLRESWQQWRSEARQRVRVLLPRNAYEWTATAVLLVVLGAYLVRWFQGNAAMLTEPNLQNDDARTVIFPFHRYASDPALRDDPIAREMLDYVPYAVRWLYALIVPAVGLLVATKVVQLLALAVLFSAAAVLLLTPGLGLPAASLLLFFVLHDATQIDRIAGGLPRSFAFPCFALWVAGAVSRRLRPRAAAAIIASLTYPSVMLMVLAAEGLLALRGATKSRFRPLLRRVLRVAMVAGTCFVLLVPALRGDASRGAIHTLAEAQQEPAFGPTGRLRVLPLPDARRELGHAAFLTLGVSGTSPLAALQEEVRRLEAPVLLAVVALLGALVVTGVTSVPWAALALGCGVMLTYTLAHLLAFRLYSPERIYSFGMHAVVTALCVDVFGRLAGGLRHTRGRVLRSLSAAGVIVFAVLALGDGVRAKLGMTIDRRHAAALYDFVAQLPKSARIASHPMDGDDLPLWTGRANMGGYETLQPWFKGSWATQRARTEDTLRAFYARSPAQVLDYARRNHVSHLLVNRLRYRGDVSRNAASFEPLTSYARRLTLGRGPEEFVLSRPPSSAVVLSHGSLELVDVAKLEKAWSQP